MDENNIQQQSTQNKNKKVRRDTQSHVTPTRGIYTANKSIKQTHFQLLPPKKQTTFSTNSAVKTITCLSNGGVYIT